MFDRALQFLKDALHAHIVACAGFNAAGVKLMKLVDETGRHAPGEGDVAISVIGIDAERAMREHRPRYSIEGNHSVVHEPDLRLNIHVIVAVNFAEYERSLECLSHVMGFFQSHPVFVPARYPDLDPRIEKLIVELQTLDYEQMGRIWGAIGAGQLPALVYRVHLSGARDISRRSLFS